MMVGLPCLLRNLFLANLLNSVTASSRPGHCRPVSKSSTTGLSSSATYLPGGYSTTLPTAFTSSTSTISDDSTSTSSISSSITTNGSTSVTSSSSTSSDSTSVSSQSSISSDTTSTTSESVTSSSSTTPTTTESISSSESTSTSISSESSTTSTSSSSEPTTSDSTSLTTSSDSTSSSQPATTESDSTSTTTESTTITSDSSSITTSITSSTTESTTATLDSSSITASITSSTTDSSTSSDSATTSSSTTSSDSSTSDNTSTTTSTTSDVSTTSTASTTKTDSTITSTPTASTSCGVGGNFNGETAFTSSFTSIIATSTSDGQILPTATYAPAACQEFCRNQVPIEALTFGVSGTGCYCFAAALQDAFTPGTPATMTYYDINCDLTSTSTSSVSTSDATTTTSDSTSTLSTTATCLSGTATACQGTVCDEDEDCCGGAYCFHAPTGRPTCLQTLFPCSATSTSESSTTATTTVSTTESLNILPTDPPAKVYNPPVIDNYDDCLVDPEDPAFYFTLIDPEDGIPIINVNGRAQKTTEILDVVPEFRFVQAANAPRGIYDLKLDDKFLAVTLDGDVIFTDTSSGQTYITENDVTFITSLFSYDCEGTLLLGIPGIVPYELGLIDGLLYGQPIIDEYNPPATGTRRRGLDFAMRQFIARARYRASLQRIPFVPKPHPTYRRDTTNGQFSDQRCPNYPFGLTPFERPDARPVQWNGCGSTGISRLVPNLDFGGCCDRHDICFDTCSQGFDSCNNDFGSCNVNACTSKHGPGLLRWGCYGLAEFYKWAVTGDSGKKAFTSSTSDRCACDCSFGQLVCGNSCMDVLSDPNNCGTCGNSCPSQQCVNGQCYVEPSVPDASEDPCNEANYYWYTDIQRQGNIFDGTFRPMDWVWQDDFTAPGSTYNTKYTCCQQCQKTSDCLAYGFLNILGSTTCSLYRQQGGMRGDHFAQPKNICPMGGTVVAFDFFGAGIGSGTDQWSTEPGPCYTG